MALAIGGCARPGAPATTRPAVPATTRPAVLATTDVYVDMYRKLRPSMVLLRMMIPADDARRRGKFDEAYGSGLVVQSGAWGSRILTDAHVVADAHALTAQIGDARKAPAHVVAVSDDRDDIAIVDTHIAHVPTVALGTSVGLEAGRPIGVMGYPIPDAFEDEQLGTKVSIYAGRVASVRRNSLELDVPIIPGESGGPVFDADSGAIIGIAESRFDEERAIGFATPIDIAVRFLSKHRRKEAAATGPPPRPPEHWGP